MAASDQVVDISEDAKAVRKRWRRAFLRIGIPILAISLVIAAILGIAVYSHYANRQGILALSDDLLDTMDAQIAQRVAAYLDPCERALRIMASIEATTPRTERTAVVERFATSALKELPQIAAFYNGEGGGDFLMVRRRESGGVEVKQIFNEADQRDVTLVERDASGEEVARRQDPTDVFDPRTRPWYEGALKVDDVFWTGIYVFFSDRKPGITVSLRSKKSEDAESVFGVDITLEELSRFLGSLEIGQSGRALIIDGDGRLIASPNATQVIKSSGADFIRPRLDELGDPVLTAAFDRFRIEGKGQRTIEKDGVKYITSSTPLPGTARNWWVLIVVPEDDFIGFATHNNRTALKMSLVIIFAVVVMAILLTQQGFRSDRVTRLMAERGRAIAEQSAAYAAISAQIGDAPAEMPPALTESLTSMTGALRASVWSLTMRGHALRCVDSYDRNSQGHVSGFELHQRELPSFFDLLQQGDVVSVSNAAGDRRTSQFYNVMMRPLGSQALTMIPVRRRDQIAGVICLEEPSATGGSQDFLRTVTSMVSPVLELPDAAADFAPEDPLASPNAPQEAGVKTSEEILSADLRLPPEELAMLDASHFAGVAVMILRLSGSLALAKKTGERNTGMAGRIAELLQEEAAQYDIKYLKFVGQQGIAAAGLHESDDDPMARVGAFAISVRERLSHLVAASDEDIEFRVGLAFGSCFGCGIGQEIRQFNLWGDAIQTADIMAASATTGAIQASEAAYARLRENFLFRPRGSFYTPGVGESRTFVLAGQL